MKEIKVSRHLTEIFDFHSDLCRTAGSMELELMRIFVRQDPPREDKPAIAEINDKFLFLENIEKRIAIIQKEYIDTHEMECQAWEYAEQTIDKGFYIMCVVDDDFDDTVT